MIIRKRKVKPDADEIDLHCIYTHKDIRASLKQYVQTFQKVGWDDVLITTTPFTQQELVNWFKQTIFAPHQQEKDFRDQLPLWGVRQAVKHRIVIEDANKPNTFYFPDDLVKRPGRPALEEKKK